MLWCASALIPTESISTFIHISPTNCWVIIDFRDWSGMCARIASSKHLLSLPLGISSGSWGAGFWMILLPTSTLPAFFCLNNCQSFNKGELWSRLGSSSWHISTGSCPMVAEILQSLALEESEIDFVALSPPPLLVKYKYFEHLDTSTTLSNGDLAIGKDPHLSTFLLLQWMIS